MFDKTRIIPTIAFLASLILTLILVFTYDKEEGWKKILIIILIVVQYVAYVWYCISYIPFGEKMLASCFKCCISSSS